MARFFVTHSTGDAPRMHQHILLSEPKTKKWETYRFFKQNLIEQVPGDFDSRRVSNWFQVLPDSAGHEVSFVGHGGAGDGRRDGGS